MTVLMADSCWKACSPHPTNKALFTPLDFLIFLSVSNKESNREKEFNKENKTSHLAESVINKNIF